MIHFYSGTPGSGKSLHVAKDIYHKVGFRHQNVIANFEVDTVALYKGKKHGLYIALTNEELTVAYLVAYALKNHRRGVEGQTLLIIDECQVIFNPREFGKKDRLAWNNFFAQHRKLGYNVILVSQMDRLVDRQIRGLFEYEYKHRKVNNYKIGAFLPVSCFCCVEYWYGVREKLNTSFFFYRKRLGSLYDSFKMFDLSMVVAVPDPEIGGVPMKSGGT